MNETRSASSHPDAPAPVKESAYSLAQKSLRLGLGSFALFALMPFCFWLGQTTQIRVLKFAGLICGVACFLTAPLLAILAMRKARQVKNEIETSVLPPHPTRMTTRSHAGRLGLVICLLVLMLVPVTNFIKARRTAVATSCVTNLRILDSAKQQWASNHAIRNPEVVPLADELIGAAHQIKTAPVCPAGGKYIIGKLKEKPTCSLGGEGHTL